STASFSEIAMCTKTVTCSSIGCYITEPHSNYLVIFHNVRRDYSLFYFSSVTISHGVPFCNFYMTGGEPGSGEVYLKQAVPIGPKWIKYAGAEDVFICTSYDPANCQFSSDDT